MYCRLFRDNGFINTIQSVEIYKKCGQDWIAKHDALLISLGISAGFLFLSSICTPYFASKSFPTSSTTCNIRNQVLKNISIGVFSVAIVACFVNAALFPALLG